MKDPFEDVHLRRAEDGAHIQGRPPTWFCMFYAVYAPSISRRAVCHKCLISFFFPALELNAHPTTTKSYFTFFFLFFYPMMLSVGALQSDTTPSAPLRRFVLLWLLALLFFPFPFRRNSLLLFSFRGGPLPFAFYPLSNAFYPLSNGAFEGGLSRRT